MSLRFVLGVDFKKYCLWKTKTLLVHQIQRRADEITSFIMNNIILPALGFQPQAKSRYWWKGEMFWFGSKRLYQQKLKWRGNTGPLSIRWLTSKLSTELELSADGLWLMNTVSVIQGHHTLVESGSGRELNKHIKPSFLRARIIIFT